MSEREWPEEKQVEQHKSTLYYSVWDKGDRRRATETEMQKRANESAKSELYSESNRFLKTKGIKKETCKLM